jgi:chromosome partitioning protein
MGSRYNSFLSLKSPSIVEVFAGYLPPGGSRTGASKLAAANAAQTIYETADRSLQLIPSRFDFSDNLTSSLRPDPRVLARFLADEFQHKDLILIDCAPTESILTHAAYHASGLVLVPVKPEFFATVGFPLLRDSLADFRRRHRGHSIEVAGVVINNGFYHGGNNGGPEKARALHEIKDEATNNQWHVFKKEIPFSRGFPKMMRGDYSYTGNAWEFAHFAEEFFDKIGLQGSGTS